MPHITTHLHLAKRLSEKIVFNNLNDLYLGSVYPDSDSKRVLSLHFKDDINSLCDLKMIDNMNDFKLGYLFHLWTDNNILRYDTSEIRKYDCIITDLNYIRDIIINFKSLKYDGVKEESLKVILNLEFIPIPLYLVSKDVEDKYIKLLDNLVDHFIDEYHIK